jgi:MoxR-like ATPase
LVGVPGVAKLLIQTAVAGADLSFNRIQFTPDLMPADITAPSSSRRSRDRTPGLQVRKCSRT